MPDIIVPLMGPDADTLVTRLASWQAEPFDVVEWRADTLANPVTPQGAVDIMARLRPLTAGRRLLFTLRSDAEGGSFPVYAKGWENPGTAHSPYAEVIARVARSGLADAIDVEVARGVTIVRDAAAHCPVVGSFHDFAGTPDVSELVARLRSAFDAGATVAKAAVMAHSPGDVVTLLDATWTLARESRPVITMAMGELGRVSRVFGHVFGSVATFASLDQASAPGQLPLAQLRALLH